MNDATEHAVALDRPRPPGMASPRRFVVASWLPSSPAGVLALTPALTFAAVTVVALAASVLVARAGRARDEARFQNATQAAVDRIVGRLDTYLALLVGGAAYVSGSDSVQAEEFGRYVALLDVARRFPGAQGVGYSRRLTAPGERLTAAERARRVRAGGSAAVDAWPLTPREEWHAIVFLEPLDDRNRAALGFDMSTDPTRRAAMLRARDTGRPAASGPVVLKQEITPDRQLGFLVYAPAFTKGPLPRTVAERRARLRGYVYAPFRVGDLFAGIFGSESAPRIAFRVFDGADTTRGRLLFDSRAVTPGGAAREIAARSVRTVDAAGRPWTISFAPRLAVGASGDAIAAAIALFGVGAGALLFRVTRAEVRARAAARRSEAARARFFAAMSHELRTPINAIMGYNDLMLAGIYGPIAPEVAHGVTRSQRAAHHLRELVNDVLDLSKLEAGKTSVAPEDVRLDALLDDLLATIRPMADERGCALEFEHTACGAVQLHTDPRRVRQILLNLLSNATRFGAGRPVHVRCTRVPGDTLTRFGFRAADAVAVDVADHGPGIALADQERIFEEFVQLPSAAPGGTGLGLAISRRLAHLLGGGLLLDSAPGRGSTFRLVLPLAPDAHTARAWSG
jgi:signal transduction histidine kinase